MNITIPAHYVLPTVIFILIESTWGSVPSKETVEQAVPGLTRAPDNILPAIQFGSTLITIVPGAYGGAALSDDVERGASASPSSPSMPTRSPSCWWSG